ncbi:MAG: sigma-70 family RNA polymerase sigma factor [Sedimentisphaerales bacterium]
MDDNMDYIELVEQARFGNRESLDILAQRTRGRLYAYVYRIMLQEDISQDIVQESMLEMFNNLDELEQADRFWPWLCKIAFNKVRRHYKKELSHRTVSISDAAYGDWPQGELRDGQTGLTALIGEELKQIVFNAMRGLKPQHRAVLAMRCYEEMQYSQIAQLMGSSELSTRVLFYRAKEALHKQLSSKGFGKDFMLSALALFGKMTAPSEVAAPSVTVTAAATNVGMAATLVGVATSKTTVVTLAAAAALAAGTILAPLPVDKAVAWTNKAIGSLQQKLTKSSGVTAPLSGDRDEYWYYYPDKADGPVITSLLKEEPQTKQSYCQRLENDQANYYFDKPTNTIHINNSRMWRNDQMVSRLPTDKASLTEFLSKVEGEGQSKKIEYVSSGSNSLLVIVNRSENSSHSHMTQHYNTLDEEYFRYNWPAGTKVVDSRDAMHKRGWTYFKITGNINGEEVSGAGRIPFVYAASEQYYPWLRLRLAHRLEIVDSINGASVYDADSRTFATYPPDTFFKGLARPWMGLHTIDTIRRDAAEQQLWFETKLTPGNSKAEVILTREQDKIVYTIDMEKDVIEKITLLSSTGVDRKPKAELKFFYLDEIKQAGEEFAEPREKDYGKPQRQTLGTLWLVQLAEGGLN